MGSRDFESASFILVIRIGLWLGVIQNRCRETESRMVPVDKGMGDSWRSRTPRPGGSSASLNRFYRGC
jgi:hypothetical protein